MSYDRIAVDWDADHTNDSWWRAGADHFLSLLPVGGRVLDV